jgi:hypothetical protein
MPLPWPEIRDRAIKFSSEWQDAGSERTEAQPFWNEFFDVFGVPRRRVASFEEPVKKLGDRRGRIDAFWKGQLVVEHKSRGQDLDRAFVQALDYSACSAEGPPKPSTAPSTPPAAGNHLPPTPSASSSCLSSIRSTPACFRPTRNPRRSPAPPRPSNNQHAEKDLGIRPLLLAHPTSRWPCLQPSQKTCSMNSLQLEPQNAA